MKIILIIFFLFTIAITKAQSYFQQEVNYVINVTLDDGNHFLHADLSLEYINNSPDTLKEIYFHLWPNAYKNNETAYAKQQSELRRDRFHFAEKNQRGYMDSLDFKVDGNSVKWEFDAKHIDICKLLLLEPLLPGKKINISTPFRVKLPSSFSRLGHWGQQYQITQWYPKPAVYDKTGWHPMSYLDMGEFYSEFGSFEVYITVPKNYVVAATGNLQTLSEQLFLDDLSEKTKGRKSFFKNENFGFPLSSREFKTICYKEKNIHDFAWFADKRYHVVKGEVILPHTKRKVTTWVYFSDIQAELWQNAIQYVNDAVYYYSLWLGDYPYDNCTAVEGALGAGGGMEYPTITNIGWAGDSLSLETVIAHEVGHNWFYGILANNERAHPWLDEGLNSFYDKRYTLAKYPGINAFQLSNDRYLRWLGIDKFPFGFMDYFAYLFVARLHIDQPVGIHSEKFMALNYGAVLYMKSSYLFMYLKKYMGEKDFDKVMKLYYEKWKFKHPQPDDLKQVFKENYSEDLSWFFEDLIETTKEIDYKIVSLKKGMDPLSFTGDCWDVTIKNCGEIAAPFPLSVIQNDSIISTRWEKGFNGTKTIKIHRIDFDKLEIDAMWEVPEINKRNNIIRKMGILKKIEPLKFQFLGSIENPKYSQLNFIPVVGWNNYNKTMAGLLLYNSVLPAKNLEYQLMPMYSYVKNDIAGCGKINYTAYFNESFIHNIDFSASASQYAYEHQTGDNFQKFKTEIDFTLQPESMKSTIEKHIIFNSIATSDINYKQGTYNFFNHIIATYKNNRFINPFSVSINNQHGYFDGYHYIKSWIETEYKFNYNSLKKGLTIRLFGGGFLYNKTNRAIYNFRLSGSGGMEDYMFDETFLGRTELIQSNQKDFLAHQFVRNDGGFTVYSPWGQSNSWLVSLNLTTTIPSQAPLRIFVNFGSFPNVNYFNSKLYFVTETGIELRLIPEICSAFFPVWMTSDLKKTTELYAPEYFQKVRFTLNLNKLNLFEQRKNLPKMMY